VADDMDRAQAANEAHQSDSILDHFRRGIRNSMYAAELNCEECGKEIPEARRKAMPGCTRCVPCQTDFELHEHWRAL
jgi:phage/conjugal plasmid C-4 type zinc finger TraR family protein